MGFVTQCLAFVCVSGVIASLTAYIGYLKFEEIEYILKTSDFIEICKDLEARCPNTTSIIIKDSTDAMWTAYDAQRNVGTCLKDFEIRQRIDANYQMMRVEVGQLTYTLRDVGDGTVVNDYLNPNWVTLAEFSTSVNAVGGRKRSISTYMMCDKNVKLFLINKPTAVFRFVE